MRSICIYFVLLSTLSTFGQTTLKGYITQYEHGDEVVECKIYNRTIEYSIDDQEVRKEWLVPLSTNNDIQDQRLRYKTLLKESNLFLTGEFSDLGNAVYSAFYNNTEGKEYLIENGDTSFIFKTSFLENSKVSTRECEAGCNYKHVYNYDGNLEYTMMTIYDSGDTLFSVFELDQEGREIYTKMNMTSLTEETYDYIKVSYKDNVRMKITEYGNTSHDRLEVVTIFNNKHGHTVYETIEYINGDDKIRWVIDYE